jgi:putative flippase GtrA
MPIRTQFIRYVVVGLASNAVIYLVYILLTRLGMGPKLAMSLLYGVGVLQTFVFNRKWSFQFEGASTPALIRYATLYAIGYAINFFAIVLLVEQQGLPHQWVMGVLVLFMAVFFFIGQKLWVFHESSKPLTEGGV